MTLRFQTTKVLSGTLPPDPSIGSFGDVYFLYDVDANGVRTLKSVYGPKNSDGRVAWGAAVPVTGVPGPRGNAVLSGSGAPVAGAGADGDYYLDVASADYRLYGPRGADGSWGAGLALKGAKGDTGTAGKTILSGSGAPANTLGAVDDYYLDASSATHRLYGPKNATSNPWSASRDLKGPQGNPGPKGLNHRGAWSSAATYAVDDAATSNGSTWRAIRQNTNVSPAEGADWTLLAAKGADGAGAPPDASTTVKGVAFLAEAAVDPANPRVLVQNSSHLATHIQGLSLAWVSGSALTVASGSAWVPGLNRVLDVPNGVAKTGLVFTANTWYYLYLFDNAGTPDVEISTVAPAAPYRGSARIKGGATPDNTRRYLGAVRTDGAGAVRPFSHDGHFVRYFVGGGGTRS